MDSKLLSIYLILFCSLMMSVNLHATHNRAGEIIIDQTGDLSIRATVVTYTKESSIQADRDELTIDWGDGTVTIAKRSNGNGNGVSIGNDNKLNLYIAEHTYSARGTYIISMTDPNRNGGIINVNPPNSVNVEFHIETEYTLLSPQFKGYNNSPRLLQPPIDIACLDRTFIHNPNAFDPDGDSLSYELIVPRRGINEPVPNYRFPQQINPGPDNVVTLDPETGNFVWDSPQRVGEYNIAMYIHEYRDGQLINSTIRDMQILVQDCENRPPLVQTVDELCIEAGKKIQIPVKVTDPDQDQLVKLEVYGGPLQLDINPATIDVDRTYREQPLEATLTWETSCNDIRDYYYTIIFRGVDNFYQTTGLSFLKNVKINIFGPQPTGLFVEQKDENTILTWDLDYECKNTRDNYFRGFQVWRKEGCNDQVIDSCNFDMESLGYEQVSFITSEVINGKYQFTDKTTEKGKSYCYRVTGTFAQLTPTGNPYNIVQSFPSEESCIQLGKNAPIIRSVSVLETDETNGEIYVEWDKPLLSEFDTIAQPGAYTYVLERSVWKDELEFEQISAATFSHTFFSDDIDLNYTDKSLDTRNLSYVYRIAFYTNSNTTTVYDYSSDASTIDLRIEPSDQALRLIWNTDVPWNNFNFRIYRLGNDETEYTLIDSTEREYYLDQGLNNGVVYCYYIESLGNYCAIDQIDTLLSLSRRVCSIPRDTTPPCPPTITVENICNNNSPSNPDDPLINTIIWTYPNGTCLESDDIDYYKIFYSQDSINFDLLAEVNFGNIQTYKHQVDQGLSGCYYITVVDLNGNESMPSEIICVGNCPDYELPNVFTPNGDGRHDFYVPRRNQFIEQVNFRVYNQWGNLVYSTTDPMLNWDGTSSGGKTLDEGTYFYKCSVFQRTLGGTELFTELTGYIELIR